MPRKSPDAAGPDATIQEAEATLRSLIDVRPDGGAGRHLEMLLASRARHDDAPKEKVHKAEARYRALVEQIPAITFMAALDQGDQELYVSPQIESILGFSQEEWLKNPILWYEQLHPDDRERWQDAFARTVTVGTPFRSEYRFLARDGRVVWVRGEAKMIRDPEGKPLFLQGVAFDITEQKEAEAILLRSREQLEEEVQKRTSELGEANRALHDREAKLRSIVESAVDGILVIDRTGIVEMFNPAAERIFGYPASEILGRNIRTLMPSPYREEHDGYLTNYLDTGIAKVIGIGRDVTGRRKDGGEFPMELAVSEMPTPEGIKFTGIVRDVTMRKRDEISLIEAKLAAEAASRLKGEFLANMSHEIRTPMNGIIGMTELALDTRLDHDQREYLETVKFSADALLTLINDILDFSKIEAGMLDLDPTEFDLREMLADSLKSMAVRAQDKGLELACEVESGVSDILMGDSGRLRQILINLVGNAIKFTATGEVVVRVGRESGPTASADFLQFSVRDSGIGIVTENQKFIFEPFSQADGSTTREFGGTGLGLTISRRLVKMMGGRIWLESQPGIGTTFYFTAELPRCLSGDQATTTEADVELRGQRVLIVDDNATNRGILERAAIGWEMAPTLCDSGPAGLESITRAVAQGRPYPLVLIDATMPGMDGFELIRRINSDASLACATIIMLSSASQLAQVASLRGIDLGAFLLKPIRRSELLEAMRTALSKVVRTGRAAPLAVSKSASHDPARLPPLSILLVEDNAVNQKLIVRLLEKYGHRAVVAGDGRQALDLLEGGRFDLVLMDVQMPVMDGLEATTALRAREARDGGHMPVIALTANAMKGDREECLQAGFDDYITKPVRWTQLEAAIEAQLRKRHRDEAPPRAVFEPAAALERLGGDLDLLREIAVIFIDDCPSQLGQVADSIARGDAKALKISAHTLKGSAANFVWPPVEDLASRLERMGKLGNFTGSQEVLSELRPVLSHFLEALGDFIGPRI